MNLAIFQILATLVDAPRDASGILEILAEQSPAGRQPSLASFYRNIKRAAEQDWLEILEERSPARGAGRPGQSYRLTPEGRLAVRSEAARLHALAAQVLPERSGSGAGAENA